MVMMILRKGDQEAAAAATVPKTNGECMFAEVAFGVLVLAKS